MWYWWPAIPSIDSTVNVSIGDEAWIPFTTFPICWADRYWLVECKVVIPGRWLIHRWGSPRRPTLDVVPSCQELKSNRAASPQRHINHHWDSAFSRPVVLIEMAVCTCTDLMSVCNVRQRRLYFCEAIVYHRCRNIQEGGNAMKLTKQSTPVYGYLELGLSSKSCTIFYPERPPEVQSLTCRYRGERNSVRNYPPTAE